jgi:hypothetical protein
MFCQGTEAHKDHLVMKHSMTGVLCNELARLKFPDMTVPQYDHTCIT